MTSTFDPWKEEIVSFFFFGHLFEELQVLGLGRRRVALGFEVVQVAAARQLVHGRRVAEPVQRQHLAQHAHRHRPEFGPELLQRLFAVFLRPHRTDVKQNDPGGQNSIHESRWLSPAAHS